MTSISCKSASRDVGHGANHWKAPLLITGCARSGTSAIAHALSSHDRYCIFNEYHLYYESEFDCNIWNRIDQMRADNPPPTKVSGSMRSLQSRLRQDLPEPVLCELTRDWLFGLMQGPVEVYGDKMPYKYLLSMREIAAMYPDAKFLITLRDGRDVVASQIRHYHRAIELGLSPEHWMAPSVRDAEYLWLRSARDWLKLRANPPAPCMELRYEEATQSPQCLAKSICDFTGTIYREKEFAGLYEQYQAVNIGAWRDEIDDMEQQLSGEFLSALAELGYVQYAG